MEKSLEREQELFTVALALPPTERDDYLMRACAGDEALRQRVCELLDKVAAAERFSEDHIVAAEVARARPMTLDSFANDRIRGYSLLHEIGEGGCAVVYRAEQLAPVRRDVAIKIIKLGMDTKAVIARFAAERQVLAIMDHPNIATVFDAGATVAGRPYFVMELVRGIRITEYCDHGRLIVAERIGLLMQLCRAIQHAHHKGIVHRDIKPSNVLVTLHDGVPTAKVIDFGIAKATQGRLTDDTLYTAIEQFVGTPAYVSPEQTKASGFDVDTRSDIYSLGVLLYELLTGCTPFSADELLQMSLERMKRRIREEHPPPPSRRLRTLAPELVENVAMLRQTSAARLIKRLEGDLDWIVMRCLEKDPARRYQTCRDLEIDLQRFLRGERVSARPPGVIDTVSRFARRRRTLLGAGAAVISMMSLATAMTAWLAVRATRAEIIARDESIAKQHTIEFLRNELVMQASWVDQPNRNNAVRLTLDRAAARIGDRFADRPLVEAFVRETLGSSYASIGDYDGAERQLRAALAAYRKSGTEWCVLLVQSELAAVLINLQRYSEAEPLLIEAYAGLVKLAGTPDETAVARVAGERILDLYTAWGKSDKARQWRQRLAERARPQHDWIG